MLLSIILRLRILNHILITIIILNYRNLTVLTQHANWDGIIKPFILPDFSQILPPEKMPLILRTLGPGVREKYSNSSWRFDIQVLGPSYHSKNGEPKTVTSLLESHFPCSFLPRGMWKSKSRVACHPHCKLSNDHGLISSTHYLLIFFKHISLGLQVAPGAGQRKWWPRTS